MSAQRDRHVPRQVGGADNVSAETERKVAWPACRAFYALVKAQHTNISRQIACAIVGNLLAVAFQGTEDLRKSRTNVGRVREAHECDSHSSGFEDDGARPVEDVKAFVERKQGKRHPAAFVIAGHEQNRHARFSELLERRERRLGEPCRYAASIEQIAAMEDHVHLAGPRRFERPFEILKEVVTSATTNDSRATGQVEAEMRVGDKQDTHVTPTTERTRVACASCARHTHCRTAASRAPPIGGATPSRSSTSAPAATRRLSSVFSTRRRSKRSRVNASRRAATERA